MSFVDWLTVGVLFLNSVMWAVIALVAHRHSRSGEDLP